ncbi:hypothetical protein MAUB_57220 [Mycolicibacterium aubagnense]|uniref:Uncharacterized protein n=1 Tax=Mycolicibacterium aubagnense TaxID=319707 RepID=A0ABN5Z4E8_9MYCO|nr:hypothetical protein MAUB_57220 [Mycolicibacterium aubagnense]
MSVGRDHDGRDLRVGDPVSLRYGGIANRGRVGANSRGEVTGFGRVNVQVHISDSSSDDLIGTTVAVPGAHLKYGHVGFVRALDRLADIRENGRTDAVLALITLAAEREIITREQAQALWSLKDDIAQPCP